MRAPGRVAGPAGGECNRWRCPLPKREQAVGTAEH